MIPLLTVHQVQLAEQIAIEAGASEVDLMLRAGHQIADRIDLDSPGSESALVLCGPGKNGGDGVVIAGRLLEFGWDVSVWCWNRDGADSAPIDEEVAQSLNWVGPDGHLDACVRSSDVIVDAVFGAGGRAELPQGVVDAFDLIRRESERRYIEVWAVDVPSGVSADTGECDDRALHADKTAMIGLPKIGAFQLPASSYTGQILAFDIGLTVPEGVDANAPRLLSPSSARQFLPKRRTGAHKRSSGTLLVVGGAPNYYGAPRLTGEAALRAGAGLVSIAAPSSIISSIATAVPELTFEPLPVSEHATAAARMASIVRDRISEVDALVIGPGLGVDAPVPEFLSQLLGFEHATRSGIGFGSHADPDPVEPFSGRAVIDADGLNFLSERSGWWETLKSAELVLTPHPGELARLLGVERTEIEARPWEKALEAAKMTGQVVVLKFAHTVVATPTGQLYVAGHAPPGLATAGSGDVLAGVIGAFLAQGLDAESAAVAGVGLGLGAAELVADSRGSIGYTASDIVRELPAARERIARARSYFS